MLPKRVMWKSRHLLFVDPTSLALGPHELMRFINFQISPPSSLFSISFGLPLPRLSALGLTNLAFVSRAIAEKNGLHNGCRVAAMTRLKRT